MMFIIGMIIGLMLGYFLLGFLSRNFERYDVIEEAAQEGSQVCRDYMNELYGDWRV